MIRCSFANEHGNECREPATWEIGGDVCGCSRHVGHLLDVSRNQIFPAEQLVAGGGIHVRPIVQEIPVAEPVVADREIVSSDSGAMVESAG